MKVFPTLNETGSWSGSIGWIQQDTKPETILHFALDFVGYLPVVSTIIAIAKIALGACLSQSHNSILPQDLSEATSYTRTAFQLVSLGWVFAPIDLVATIYYRINPVDSFQLRKQQ